jgi:hypothetical protein
MKKDELGTDAKPVLADEDFADLEDEICPDCECCSTVWHECEHCGGDGGTDGDELMMEDPFWYSPYDFRECDICEGKGGWVECLRRGMH